METLALFILIALFILYFILDRRVRYLEEMAKLQVDNTKEGNEIFLKVIDRINALESKR